MVLWLPEAPALSQRSVAAASFLVFFWLVASVTAISGPVPLVMAGTGAAMVIAAPLLGREKRGEHGGMPDTPMQPDGASRRR
jgi:hypothetical protein